jgi:hypothetical protein
MIIAKTVTFVNNCNLVMLAKGANYIHTCKTFERLLADIRELMGTHIDEAVAVAEQLFWEHGYDQKGQGEVVYLTALGATRRCVSQMPAEVKAAVAGEMEVLDPDVGLVDDEGMAVFLASILDGFELICQEAKRRQSMYQLLSHPFAFCP